MKKLMFAVAALTTFTIVADNSPSAQAPAQPQGTAAKEPAKKVSRTRLSDIQMKRFGGIVPDRREQRGSVVVVNAQKAADVAWFAPVIKDITNLCKLSLEVKEGSFNLAKPVLPGAACVFVVDDPALPMSLFAAEAKWAMVNVAPLKEGEGAKPQFFKARVQKAVSRGLAYLMGAANGQYPMSVCGCITKPEDLDQLPSYRLSVDIIGKFEKYVAGYGITPYKRTTYRKSIEEGWGAQPTNQFQQAIWDEVHTLPSDPIKIKYDPKRDK